MTYDDNDGNNTNCCWCMYNHERQEVIIFQIGAWITGPFLYGRIEEETYMASENKKRKLKNSYQYKTYLKAKGKGIKGMTFYTSSERQRLKRLLSKEVYHAGDL